MALNEQNREDVLREATALTVRAEFTAGGFAESIVIGFRSNEAASVFLGADPVYHFNTSDQLRRGFRDGRLIKAVGGTLFELRRERTDGEVQLLRRELSDGEKASYLAECGSRLDAVHERLKAGDFDLIGQVPANGNAEARIIAWLESLPEVLEVAEKPNVA